MEVKSTERGFPVAEFKDKYNNTCSIQQSSIMDEPCIWLGVDDGSPKILSEHGWVDYPLHESVSLTTRMHLNISQVEELLPLLKRFIETGQII